MVNKQLHAYNTRKNNDYKKYVHGMDLYNSKRSVAGCRFYNKLPKNIKQIDNKNQFTRELKKFLIKECFYSIDDYLSQEFPILVADTIRRENSQLVNSIFNTVCGPFSS
jgi:hypothetical protein